MKFVISLALLLTVIDSVAQAVKHETPQLRGALEATDFQYSGCSFGKVCSSNSDCCPIFVCKEFYGYPGPKYCLREIKDDENKEDELLGTNEKLRELENGKKDYSVEQDISSDFVEEQRGCYSFLNPCSSDSDCCLTRVPNPCQNFGGFDTKVCIV